MKHRINAEKTRIAGQYEITRELATRLLPARREDSSKRDYGRVLIIAGTEGMMGAAVLCTRASLRSGAGLVTLCCPREQFCIPQTAVPEAMCVPRDLSLLTAEYLNGFSAIAFGPGCLEPAADLPTACECERASFAEKETNLRSVLSRILETYKGILIVDASGLDMLHDAEAQNQNFSHGCKLIVTPHCAEAARLLDTSYESVKKDRDAAAVEIAEKYRAVSLVKGPQTKIAVQEPPVQSATHRKDAEYAIYTNSTGNSGMATGGAGDVLTGIIAGLSAQLAVSGFADETQNDMVDPMSGKQDLVSDNLDPVSGNPDPVSCKPDPVSGKPDPVAAATVLGAYLHGLAGDLAAEGLGKYSLIAVDLVTYLPKAFLSLLV